MASSGPAELRRGRITLQLDRAPVSSRERSLRRPRETRDFLWPASDLRGDWGVGQAPAYSSVGENVCRDSLYVHMHGLSRSNSLVGENIRRKIAGTCNPLILH